MVFADLLFLYFFLPVCLICYFITRNANIRNIVLIVFSMIFYAWGEPVWVSILAVSALVDYCNGRVIEKHPEGWQAKLALAWSLIFNLGLLFGFKYTGFFVENLNNAAGLNIPVPHIKLPIGISFYTFQTISYTIDCYWGKVKPQKSFLKFLMYVSLFPQLVAGPIVRYSVIAEEIEDRKTTINDISEGFSRIILGLGKKVLIANSLSTVVTSLFGNADNKYSAIDSLSVLGTWYGAILVGLWYYFDFSGYSDIAIGLGRIFGFHFDENFKYPFICKTISEFWQRWHISLSSFFRDYVLYIPIFGKRRKYGGLFLVWFLTGLWHGASWNFVFWGLYYGLFIMMEMMIGKKKMKKMPVPAAHIYTKTIIFLGFGIFYFESLPKLCKFFKGLIGLNGNSFCDSYTANIFMGNIFLFIAAIFFAMPVIPKIREKAFRKPGSAYIFQSAGVICNALILIASSLLLLNNTNNPFLYFRF
ncbi:alginate O-acetyltransferase [Ruminococcus albus SY3]|uniref:Alginate O-acetyltransferase n=1 Tax=Ruminococcus albus SY3 TaxID=1341156 RepID=A0A011VX91_RUMAL|nr:MBOAT family O-acyltransferase [Ruminococcus albus]EXM39233.1 alginate O-acetyltransferase [Ruminococcus albus SY3]